MKEIIRRKIADCYPTLPKRTHSNSIESKKEKKLIVYNIKTLYFTALRTQKALKSTIST